MGIGVVALFSDPDAGAVDGEVLVDADLDEVVEWLGDPTVALAAIDRDVVALFSSGCAEVTREVDHPLAPLVFTVRWCPTPVGAHITLLESEDLSAYEATWSARPAPGGVLVRYHLIQVPAFRAPASLNRAAARRQASTALRAVATAFEGAITTDDLR